MLIKSVKITNFDATNDPYNDGGGRYLFYDENGDLIESGNLISQTSTTCETDNFNITCMNTFSNNIAKNGPYNAFRTDEKTVTNTSFVGYISEILTTGDFIKCEFKTPKVISKIECCLKTGDISYSANAHAADIIIETVHGYQKTFNISVSTGAVYNEVVDIVNPIVFNTTKYGEIETTIDTNITNIEEIEGLELDYDMPTGTEIRFALSNDDRNTYKIFNGTDWASIDKSSIITDGMLPADVLNIPLSNLKSFLPSSSSLNVFAMLSTSNMYYSPVLKTIILKERKLLDKNDAFLIKSVLINNYDATGDTYDNAGGRFLFYDKDNNLIESGNLISQNMYGCETDNFIVECYELHSLGTSIGSYNAIRTDEKTIFNCSFDTFVMKNGYASNSFTKITFKTPVAIGKMECSLKARPNGNNYSNAHAADVNFIFETGKIITQRVTQSVGQVFNEITTLKIEDNIFPKVYNENEAEIITNLNQLEQNCEIQSIKVNAFEDTDTKIRFALSDDDRTTWYVFKNNSFSIIDKTDIINNGNTVTELESIPSTKLASFSMAKKVDVITKMITSNTSKTPSIKNMTITVVK